MFLAVVGLWRLNVVCHCKNICWSCVVHYSSELNMVFDTGSDLLSVISEQIFCDPIALSQGRRSVCYSSKCQDLHQHQTISHNVLNDPLLVGTMIVFHCFTFRRLDIQFRDLVFNTHHAKSVWKVAVDW